VLQTIGTKMIRRHPHVFGDVVVENSDEVLRNWQTIKSEDKKQSDSLLDGQNRHMSSLLTSLNYQKEAAKVGFDWPTIEGAFDKFAEEWKEFQHEVDSGSVERQLDELGDVLFTVVNIARFLKLSPEEAMIHANQKFRKRFSFVEESVLKQRGDFLDYTLYELEGFWQEAKGKEEGYEN